MFSITYNSYMFFSFKNFFSVYNILTLMHYTVIYCSFFLFFLFCLTTTLSFITSKYSKFNVIFRFVKTVNIGVIFVLGLAVTLKVFIFIFYSDVYSTLIATHKSCFLLFNSKVLTLSINTSILSDVVLLLCFTSGFVCIILLGNKKLVSIMSNLSFFSMFLIATVIMVYTTNLLIMFISFELLFLPTLYFAYTHGYVKKLDRTLWYLLYWTLAGAFLTLITLSYIYAKYKTLNLYELSRVNFTVFERLTIYLGIFTGFGVKVPIFPFHFWLTKIHVEAPAGFSIFLSGFLVKASLYCLYMFNLVFSTLGITKLIVIIGFFGICESSVKMFTQTDFKKLIAFATIQEMNLILILLFLNQMIISYGLVLFILIHGWLSTLMFHSVDVLQRKTGTRNMLQLSGVGLQSRQITLLFWFILIIFSGFPLTVKFVIEWQVLGVLLFTSPSVSVIVFFFAAVIGLIGFAKQILIILYGNPRRHLPKMSPLSKIDKFLFYLSIFMLTTLQFIHFLL